MGVTTLHEGASPLTTIRDHAKTTEEKQDGAYTSRVYGTYVHGVFDKEGVAEAVIRALGKREGIDASEMKGVDFQTFKGLAVRYSGNAFETSGYEGNI